MTRSELERRIVELERKLADIERVMKPNTTSVKFVVPVNIERQLYVNGSQVT